MFALVQWVVDQTTSIVSIDAVTDSKKEGDTSAVKYGDTSYTAKIIRISEDRKYLSSIHLTTDGHIIQKRKGPLPKVINVEKKKSIASMKKKERAGAAHSANLDDETVLQMQSIYYDSDSTSKGTDNAEIRSESRDLHDDGKTNPSRNRSPGSGKFDSAITDVDKEIEELEKLLADKVSAKRNLQQRQPDQPRANTEKIGPKPAFEHIGVVENDNNNNICSPAKKRKRNAESSSGCAALPQQQHQLQNTQPGTSSALSRESLNPCTSNSAVESAVRQQDVGVPQSNCNRQQQRLGTRVQRIPRARDIADIEDTDDPDNLQLCRQGGAGRVLLVEAFNVWIDKAELMYYQRWVDNPPEMVRRLLKLLVGEQNLLHMCARGLSKDPLIKGIPSDILRCVEYYVNKKCNSCIPPSRYITIVNMMCQTLRHPKHQN